MVHLLIQLKGILHRQVPVQLGTLAENNADILSIFLPVPIRQNAVYRNRSGSRHQDS